MTDVIAVVAIAAAEFGVDPERVLSKYRGRKDVARARQVAMWALHDAVDWTPRRIAEAFGRDPSTVRHAIRVVDGRLKTPLGAKAMAAHAAALAN